ncbi:MAG TPA: hypothetical protein VF310_11780 [Vicinamibacteria bacterium]
MILGLLAAGCGHTGLEAPPGTVVTTASSLSLSVAFNPAPAISGGMASSTAVSVFFPDPTGSGATLDAVRLVVRDGQGAVLAEALVAGPFPIAAGGQAKVTRTLSWMPADALGRALAITITTTEAGATRTRDWTLAF